MKYGMEGTPRFKRNRENERQNEKLVFQNENVQMVSMRHFKGRRVNVSHLTIHKKFPRTEEMFSRQMQRQSEQMQRRTREERPPPPIMDTPRAAGHRAVY